MHTAITPFAFQLNLDLVRLATQQQTPQRQAPHKCSEPGCDRAFNRKYTLTEHAKTHTGDKPYVCPIASCGKRFTTTGNLSRHRRLHGPVLPLQCSVAGCPCSFSSELKLEKHMKFHFGTSEHLCDVPGCGKTFSTVGNLNRHLRNQHNIHDQQLQQLSISTPLCRSPKTAVAHSPTGADDDDWLFSLAGDELEDFEEDNDDAWLSVCVADMEPLTAEEAAQPWDPEALDALSLMLDSETGEDAN